MTLLENAELFAKSKHAGKLKKSGMTYSNHLENVVSRLKSLGIRMVAGYFRRYRYKF